MIAGCHMNVCIYGRWVERQFVAAEQVSILPTSAAAHPEFALGPLGMPARTAWYGLEEILRVRPGDVCYVSAAAGAASALLYSTNCTRPTVGCKE